MSRNWLAYKPYAYCADILYTLQRARIVSFSFRKLLNCRFPIRCPLTSSRLCSQRPVGLPLEAFKQWAKAARKVYPPRKYATTAPVQRTAGKFRQQHQLYGCLWAIVSQAGPARRETKRELFILKAVLENQFVVSKTTPSSRSTRQGAFHMHMHITWVTVLLREYRGHLQAIRTAGISFTIRMIGRNLLKWTPLAVLKIKSFPLSIRWSGLL